MLVIIYIDGAAHTNAHFPRIALHYSNSLILLLQVHTEVTMYVWVSCEL